jgi:hypothetical protein
MAQTREIVITLTRATVENMSEILWLELSRWPTEWEQRPDPYRDTMTWVIPEREFLIIVLKHPELLDLEVL